METEQQEKRIYRCGGLSFWANDRQVGNAFYFLLKILNLKCGDEVNSLSNCDNSESLISAADKLLADVIIAEGGNE